MTEDPFVQPNVVVAVTNVVTVVELLGEATTVDEMSGLPWEDAALLLKQLRAARADLHRLESAFERHIAEEWHEVGLRHPQPIAGVGMVDVRHTRQRRGWQHEAVMGAVLDAHLTETGGEFPDPWEVRDWIMEAGHVDYWRVTTLRGLGLDPDDYSTPAGDATTTVRIG